MATWLYEALHFAKTEHRSETQSVKSLMERLIETYYQAYMNF